MVQLGCLMLSAVWLGKVSIKGLGVVVEQSPCLVRHLFSMVPEVVPMEIVVVEAISQIVQMQIGLGWVALWEVGLG